MAEPATYATLQALGTQLSVISIANGYNTDIGTKILLYAIQRDDGLRPSIAIGAPSGDLDLSGERSDSGVQISPRARRMAIVVEAAMDSTSAEESDHLGHLMLEDIERAMAVPTGLAPKLVRDITLIRWSIVDRPDGAKSVVLQIEGTATYQRST
jgi:hypothetical protein